VSQVANKIWYIENQQIKEYPGTYEEYEYWRKQNENNQDVPPPVVKKEQKPKPEVKSDETEKKIKALQQDLKRTEDSIAQLEKDKAAAEEQLAKPEVFGNTDKLAAAQAAFEKVDKLLKEANEKWEQLVDQLDDLS
jgi:ATP-binding cassette subfamily F protein 3